ncbi:hypothetical protein PRIPAC_70828 [Pristionchus pacificus]|uniref:Uncharacterized protein n=1 Tax=Pristionchus pacificus TaxID=54126 RepID=A0A454Y181_PRIPA|nr:hypothetical protein PRIPAC_70828 [Pristionchus pacificus]|eukprot:PDM76649.1 hypothetical protein PRIPAC_42044 [Pristionchus pacificus]
MSSHPMLSNAMHARVQRKRLETRADLCAKKAAEPVVVPMLTQQALAAATVAAHNAVPTIRKPHHNAAHTGHHHVHHSGNTLVIGGIDTKLLESVQKLFARRILH